MNAVRSYCSMVGATLCSIKYDLLIWLDIAFAPIRAAARSAWVLFR
jgi:hypothetical protein